MWKTFVCIYIHVYINIYGMYIYMFIYKTCTFLYFIDGWKIYMKMCVSVSPNYVHWESLRAATPQQQRAHLGHWSCLVNTVPNWNDPGLLEDISDSRGGAWKVQDQSGMSFVMEFRGILKTWWVHVKWIQKTAWKVPTGQILENLNMKIMTTMHYNPRNTI